MDDGTTLRNHLECEYRQTRVKPDQLKQPEFPLGMAMVWSYFKELCGARQNGMGLNPISYTEIKAWDELTGAGITPREVQIVKALDNIYLAHNQPKAK